MSSSYPEALFFYRFDKMCFFAASVILLLSTWTGRRSGIASANSDAILGVDACLQTFKMCETRLVDVYFHPTPLLTHFPQMASRR